MFDRLQRRNNSHSVKYYCNKAWALSWHENNYKSSLHHLSCTDSVQAMKMAIFSYCRWWQAVAHVVVLAYIAYPHMARAFMRESIVMDCVHLGTRPMIMITSITPARDHRVTACFHTSHALSPPTTRTDHPPCSWSIKCGGRRFIKPFQHNNLQKSVKVWQRFFCFICQCCKGKICNSCNGFWRNYFSDNSAYNL